VTGSYSVNGPRRSRNGVQGGNAPLKSLTRHLGFPFGFPLAARPFGVLLLLCRRHGFTPCLTGRLTRPLTGLTKSRRPLGNEGARKLLPKGSRGSERRCGGPEGPISAGYSLTPPGLNSARAILRRRWAGPPFPSKWKRTMILSPITCLAGHILDVAPSCVRGVAQPRLWSFLT
jgi:hypothetical protein